MLEVKEESIKTSEGGIKLIELVVGVGGSRGEKERGGGGGRTSFSAARPFKILSLLWPLL